MLGFARTIVRVTQRLTWTLGGDPSYTQPLRMATQLANFDLDVDKRVLIQQSKHQKRYSNPIIGFLLGSAGI